MHVIMWSSVNSKVFIHKAVASKLSNRMIVTYCVILYILRQPRTKSCEKLSIKSFFFMLPLTFCAAPGGVVGVWKTGRDLWLKRRRGDVQWTWKRNGKKEGEQFELLLALYVMNDLTECCLRDAGKVSHCDEHRLIWTWFNYTVW